MLRSSIGLEFKSISGHTVDDINLHCLKDPELWELWYLPYGWVMQDLYYQP